MSFYHALKTAAVDNGAVINNTFNVVTTNTKTFEQLPAEQFLRPLPAIHIDVDACLDDATLVLNKTHQSVALVMNSANEPVGLIALAQLGSRNVLEKAQKMGVSRSELVVSDMMVPIASLRQISTAQVVNALVGDIKATIEADGLSYLFVQNSQKKAVGYFDIIDLVKRSNGVISTLKASHDFKDVVAQILHNKEM
ncbi:hypothetical protein [Pseudoalteromonas luteoviolacea]|uniref:CBS domain-containing protein n=1 Tax=Pseudoalteromonas luteoviolacea S4054 TaxID=1129367 RepID=A0A0F6ACS9_9GAMM|nr:hypothetical protein [Pseudoalteromonas luteoviolacea]AOT09527.1 hypothetical protein S4054249_17585 [Pseudoalteromonas luteoviolacea]AOT14439.1 hypothetical protein S40542_17555 [Pseudoalteromonas luteoviolacea]AOT19355.1 hypothetical protein S4054_17560 [Pseudoalteromonas luteoviolacea]KKE83214.1 hypothetical protein N479_15330 [Pseudoalteromonas luteoviolacea S4054]KZN68843.1 hypothetical protein N481_23140 [Pseudoalteromonas luteoviolacea S4047-1]